MPGVVLDQPEEGRLSRPARQGAVSRRRGVAPSGWWVTGLALGAIAFGALGLYIAVFLAPVDPHRGDLYRIVYIHVPATWMAILLFFVVAVCAAVGSLSRAAFTSIVAQTIAPTGTMFAFMALWTGALWGKPIWGTWWTWDVRLIADLALLLIDLSIVGIYAEFEDFDRADRIVAWIAVPGAMIVLALLFSVALYPSVPGTPTHALPEVAAIRTWTGVGLFAVAASFACYSGAIILRRLCTVRLERRRQREWWSQGFLKG